jgi:hypothetical protein
MLPDEVAIITNYQLAKKPETFDYQKVRQLDNKDFLQKLANERVNDPGAH